MRRTHLEVLLVMIRKFCGLGSRVYRLYIRTGPAGINVVARSERMIGEGITEVGGSRGVDSRIRVSRKSDAQRKMPKTATRRRHSDQSVSRLLLKLLTIEGVQDATVVARTVSRVSRTSNGRTDAPWVCRCVRRNYLVSGRTRSRPRSQSIMRYVVR